MYKKKPAGEFTWVRSIYGKGADAKKRYEHIVDGGMNDVIKSWQSKQPEHPREIASPSTLSMCPRVVWLLNHDVPVTNEMTWAVKQRLLLGRLFEDQFAKQLKDEGLLLFHWADNPGQEVEKFKAGEGNRRLQGVPDYLLELNGEVIISDAKTSRSDSFGYIAIEDDEIFKEWGWYKYRLQLTAYFMLCHANKDWFEKNKFSLPTKCHLFSYALDDGVVRREITWTPTKVDMETVFRFTERYNKGVASKVMPDCTCKESFDEFDVKFCKYGIVNAGDKIAKTCCSPSVTLKDLVE